MNKAILAVLAFALTAGAQTNSQRLYWAGSWTASPMPSTDWQQQSYTEFRDVTLRQIVHLSSGGSYVRVRFSNVFGDGPLWITSAHIARAVSAPASAIDAATDTALAFGGQPDVMIPQGAAYLSDPVKFEAAADSDLAVSFHIDAPAYPGTYHDDANQTMYVAHGDQVAAPQLHDAATMDHWYWLTGVDVGTPAPDRCIVAFGDSITDGWRSDINGNNRWPDDLSSRLRSNAATRSVCVLNEGISGNRILMNGGGPSALARFDRDVLSQPGVRYVIILEGINDLGNLAQQGNVSAADLHFLVQQLISADRQMIADARALGIQAIGATLTPFGGSDYYTSQGTEFDAARQELNDWIRAPGHFDKVVDFDKATRDPSDPTRFLPACDSGDHLHPNPAGYRAMANAIPLEWFASE
ncbi:MAG TPA: SGNH/GDSL hydrolase family protein [Acidobacteriaceae bacterium]|nr:SGNH/GDSL hydrolase family protein [Acidobacteriaceae bacterium]